MKKKLKAIFESTTTVFEWTLDSKKPKISFKLAFKIRFKIEFQKNFLLVGWVAVFVDYVVKFKKKTIMKHSKILSKKWSERIKLMNEEVVIKLKIL